MVETTRTQGGESPMAEEPASYDASFWYCCASNTLMMISVSLLYRYADFVAILGGNELDLGLIVGVGMVGSLSMRIVLGVAMDRLGPRRIWIWSLVAYIASLLGHLLITRVDGPGIYLIRMLMNVSLAGAFGASLTYVSLRAPEHRMAEMIGTIGSSGFLGMALGPALGDMLFSRGSNPRAQVVAMFLWSAAAAGAGWIMVVLASRHAPRLRRRRISVPAWRIARRYQPGAMLFVSAAMGIGICLPYTFLRAYARQLGIPDIGGFFLVYAAVAFVVRIAMRRATQLYGVDRVITAGMFCLAGSMLLYLAVGSPWSLALPAVLAGAGHALLFPAVIAGGSLAFPIRYRGLATTIMLAMFDLGNLLGQPLVGGLLELCRRWHVPDYPAMFVAMAGLLIGVQLFYLWRRHRWATRRSS